MKYEDLKMMYEEISHIRSMMIEHQDTLEGREWADFSVVLTPQLRRFEWLITTIDEELTSLEKTG